MALRSRLSAILGTIITTALLLAPAISGAQTDTTEVVPDSAKVAAKAAKKDSAKSKIKPYTEVITREARSDSGVFVTHLIGDKLFYEIPEVEIGRSFLWVTTIARTQTGKGYGGTGYNNQVVRWDRRGNRILLRQMRYLLVASDSVAAYNAVQASSYPPILMAFDIKAFGGDSSAVIDVTPLFTADMPEFSPKKNLKAKKLDKKRSYVERVVSFPENIETEVILTYEAEATGRSRSGTVSVVVHHSMIHLPKKPMMPRLEDSRVGYFSVTRQDYGTDEHRVARRRYITRWRLEKKHPDRKLSEPVKPIVFYIDRTVPEKWRPWFKKGIEAWQPAFEQAGFKNAIIGKYPPTPEEDPDWSTEDARISSIGWLASTVENAYGPHVHDPRSGEILDADIRFFHNILNLVKVWYVVQVGPLDPRAAKLPLPDDLMGELLQYVASHEVGHSLGLPHNMKASSSYTVEQLRDARFTARNGNEASIMDYGRFNYVAQPGDKARLIPIIGPYDRFAIEWGHKPIPGAGTPDDEKPELDRIARRQDRDPILRFGGWSRFDPTAQTEDLGSDPVAATRLGLRNIQRVKDMLLAATTQEGEDYRDLSEFYRRMMGQRDRELGHVASVIGGVEQVNRHAGQDGAVYLPIPRSRQEEAMRFLVANAFTTPVDLLDTDILELIEPSGSLDRVAASQRRILRRLLANDRAKRMLDQEAKAAGSVPPYPLSDMLADLREGIWRELADSTVVIDPYRRNLQRAHVDQLISKISKDTAINSDLRPLARGELKAIARDARDAASRARDRVTQLHLEDIGIVIDQALDPD